MSSTLTGIGIGRNSVVGTAVVWTPNKGSAHAMASVPAGREGATILAAMEDVATDLLTLAARQRGVARDVLNAQAMMMQDEELVDEILGRIHDGAPVAQAVAGAFGLFQGLMENAGGYIAGRAADIDDLKRRLTAKLAGEDWEEVPDPDHPFILIATDLAPADTAQLDPKKVLAFVTEEGGPTSHTAILARARGIPAIVACPGVLGIHDQATVLVDAWRGRLTIEPTPEEVSRVTEKRERARRVRREPGRTKDGEPVALLANVGSPADVEKAVEASAEGVGLMRTEFLFVDRDEAPGRDEQVRIYSQVLQAFPGRKVVARVLDAGADKPMKFLPQGVEPNPALGMRGLRALRAHLELLDGQLETLAKAQADSDADLWVMAPMVSDADEAEWFAQRARSFGLGTVGAMVEVPAAAITARQFLRPLDFVSVGTNDLAQYTMAADRMLGAVGGILDPWSPAVLRLVKLTAEEALAAGKTVSVCGEAAADPVLACAFVGVGVGTLSMSPSALGIVRESLADSTLERCRDIAGIIMESGSARLARQRVSALHHLW